MSVKDQYIDLCEARVEALYNEVRLLKEFIIRDYATKGISGEMAMDLFKAFKENEDSSQD
jgi:hypothetical protein